MKHSYRIIAFLLIFMIILQIVPIYAAEQNYENTVFNTGVQTSNEADVSSNTTNQSSGGIEEKWSYETCNLSSRQTVYVNRATGDITFENKDISLTDRNGIQFTVKRFGNASKTEDDSFGRFWRFNIQEKLQLPTVDQDYFIYVDEDGTSHYFNTDVQNSEYTDTDLSGLILKIESAGYSVRSANGIIHNFNNTGRLVSIEDNGSCFEFTYDENDRISYISPQDEPDNRLDFIFSNNGYIWRIVKSANGETVQYLVARDGIVNWYRKPSAEEPMDVIDGCIITDNFMETMVNYDENKTVWINYTNGDAPKVRTIEVYTGTENLDQKYIDQIYNYEDHATYIYTPGADETFSAVAVQNGNITVDHINCDDIVTAYLFDDQDRVMQVYSQTVDRTEFYGGTIYEYTDIGKIKRLTSLEEGISSNYIMDPMFDTLPAYTNTDYTYGLDSSNKLFGTNSAMIEANQNCYDIGKYTIPVPYIPANSECVLSCYVKTTQLNGQVYLRFYNPSDPEADYQSVQVTESTSQDVGNGWRRLSVSFHAVSAVGSYIDLIMNARSGRVYFDGLQLEVGNVPTVFSPLINGSAGLNYRAGEGWLKLHAGTGADNSDQNANITYLYIDGNSNAQGLLSQTVSVNAPLQNVFVLSGRTKGLSAATGSGTNAPLYRVESRIVLSNKDGTGTWAQAAQVTDLPRSNEWRFFSHCAYVDRTDSRITDQTIIQSVTVQLTYSYNSSRAYFTDLALKSSPSAEYSYDTEGNITGVSVNTMSASSYYDENGDEIQSGGNTNCLLTYDDTGNIQKETYADGSTVHYTYVKHGDIYDCSSTIQRDKNAKQISKTLYTYAAVTYTGEDGVSNTKYKLTNIAEYDAQNIKMKETVYTYISSESDDYSTITVKDGNSKLISSQTYTYLDGSVTVTLRDCTNKVITNVYDNEDNLLSSENGRGTTTYYTNVETKSGRTETMYTDSNNDSEITEGVDAVITKLYNEDGQMTKIDANSSYSFAYNLLGSLSKIKVGTQDLAIYEYNTFHGKISRITYGNGDIKRFVYDNRGNLTSLYTGFSDASTETLSCTWTYGTNGLLYMKNDLEAGERYYYEYDDSERLIRYAKYNADSSTGEAQLIVEYGYQGETVSTMRYIMAGTTLEECMFTYNEDGHISAYGSELGLIRLTYDTAKRITSRALAISDTVHLSESYTYLTVSGFADESPVVASFTAADGTVYSYTYDNNYNITQVKENGILKISYQYDNFNRVIRENNVYTNRTYCMTYDLYGNILTNNTYAYTTGVVGTSIYSGTYVYGNTEWPDLLTSYNGEAFTYDSIGNPTHYYNGSSYNFLWNRGRQLKSYWGDGIDTEFLYDADGFLIGIGQAGVYVTLIRDGGKILKEIITIPGHMTKERVYFYDEMGTIAGMRSEGQTYYFETDLQGSVIKIYDGNGQVVVNYYYDAWGYSSISGSLRDTVGRDNAFRYRGYYYVDVLDFYYCNSRFYDPVLGRFINADDPMTVGSGKTTQGYNLFSYCENNPVNMADPGGNIPRWMLAALQSHNSNFFIFYYGIKYALEDAGILYLDYKGYFLAKELYEHAITGKGRALSSYVKSLLISRLTSSSILKNELIKAVKYPRYRRGNSISHYGTIEFRPTNSVNADLYYAVQKVQYGVSGILYNGVWNLRVVITDYYNFDQIRTFSKFSFGNVANDIGYLMQKAGMITPYWIYVAFNYILRLYV